MVRYKWSPYGPPATQGDGRSMLRPYGCSGRLPPLGLAAVEEEQVADVQAGAHDGQELVEDLIGA